MYLRRYKVPGRGTKKKQKQIWKRTESICRDEALRGRAPDPRVQASSSMMYEDLNPSNIWIPATTLYVSYKVQISLQYTRREELQSATMGNCFRSKYHASLDFRAGLGLLRSRHSSSGASPSSSSFPAVTPALTPLPPPLSPTSSSLARK